MKSLDCLAALALSIASCCALALDSNEEIVPESEKPEFRVYAATWQPAFCAKSPSTAGCNPAPEMFLAHGIWPYNASTAEKTNRHPQNCTRSAACAGDACPMTEEAMQAVLDNQKIRSVVTAEPKGMFAHEWKKHGTCSGKTMQAYFQDLADLYPSVVQYNQAMFKEWIGKRTPFATIRQAFPSNTSFRCFVQNNEQYLHEVFYLIDADGKPFNTQMPLQIGIACQDRDTLIPGGESLSATAKPQP